MTSVGRTKPVTAGQPRADRLGPAENPHHSQHCAFSMSFPSITPSLSSLLAGVCDPPLALLANRREAVPAPVSGDRCACFNFVR